MLISLLALCHCHSLSCPLSNQFIPWSIILLYKTLSMDLQPGSTKLVRIAEYSESESVLPRFPLTCEMHLGSYIAQ